MQRTFAATVIGAEMREAKTGTPQVRLIFELRDGSTVDSFHAVTDAALEYTIGSLRTCGWKGDDLDDLSSIERGLPVELVVDDEEYKGKVRSKVKFINPAGGRGGTAPTGIGARFRDKIAALANGGGAGSNEPDPFDEAIRRHQKPA